MKLISAEEARQYIPCKEDFAKRPAAYFTLTPSKEPGWENYDDVTYYTAKKRLEYEGREGDGNSWVYILTSPALPGLCKVGYTKKEPEERAKEVSRGTGVPQPFEVAWAFKCFDGDILEREVHKFLDKYRENVDREFFRVDFEEAKNAIRILGERYVKSSA